MKMFSVMCTLAALLSISACTSKVERDELPLLIEKDTPFTLHSYQANNAQVTQQVVTEQTSDAVVIVPSAEYVYWVKPEVVVDVLVSPEGTSANSSEDDEASAPDMSDAVNNAIDVDQDSGEIRPIQPTPNTVQETIEEGMGCRSIYVQGELSGVLNVGADNVPVDPELATLYSCDDDKCQAWFEADNTPVNCQDSLFFMVPECFGKGDLACEYRRELFVCNNALSACDKRG